MPRIRLESFLGQSILLPRLIDALRNGRIAHSVLFTGLSGSGKRTLARLCAQAVHCAAPPEARPCGACPACKRFESGNHPDDMILSTDKTSIGVEAVRELKEALSARSYEGGQYTVRIERADRMTPQAQNALLKTMEDPVGPTAFFLTADAPKTLLPTVLSRCLIAPISPAGRERVEICLEQAGAPPEKVREIAPICGGLYGKALALLQDEDIANARRAALRALLEPGGAAETAERAAEIAALKAYSDWILDAWETAFRDMLALSLGARIPLCNEDFRDALTRRSRDFTARFLSGMMEEAREARRRLGANVSWAHASESALLCWMEGSRT